MALHCVFTFMAILIIVTNCGISRPFVDHSHTYRALRPSMPSGPLMVFYDLLWCFMVFYCPLWYLMHLHTPSYPGMLLYDSSFPLIANIDTN